jgi:hypothetical protein
MAKMQSCRCCKAEKEALPLTARPDRLGAAATMLIGRSVLVACLNPSALPHDGVVLTMRTGGIFGCRSIQDCCSSFDPVSFKAVNRCPSKCLGNSYDFETKDSIFCQLGALAVRYLERWRAKVSVKRRGRRVWSSSTCSQISSKTRAGNSCWNIAIFLRMRLTDMLKAL